MTVRGAMRQQKRRGTARASASIYAASKSQHKYFRLTIRGKGRGRRREGGKRKVGEEEEGWRMDVINQDFESQEIIIKQ